MAKTDKKKLKEAVAAGFRKQKHFRKGRLMLLNQYVSRFYKGDGGGDSNRAMPINAIHQAATTLVPNLVYRDPKSKVSTGFLAYRPYAELLGMATDHLVKEIELRHTLRMVVTDSIFSVGWIKTGLGVSGQTLDLDGYLHDVGQPYADRVDPDDMVIDPNARTIEEASFIGNRFRISREELRESGLVKDEVLEKLTGRFKAASTTPEASALSAGDTKPSENEDLFDYVDLVEVWLPKENRIVTLPYCSATNGVLDEEIRSVDYEGPEHGPYHMLGFAFAPDNIMPVAPAMVWYDLHMMLNKVARKVARQAERQKSILAYEYSAWEDALTITESSDGDTIGVNNIDMIREVAFGGASDDGYRYIDWAKNNFSEMAMNIDLMSGSGTNEPTASQAEIVQGNSTVRLADMQQIVYDFAARAMTDLAFFLHTDPLIELPLIKRDKGKDRQVVYTPDLREGDWLDYSISVVPQSMGRQDPNVKVRRLLEFAGSAIPALAQASQMLGPAFKLDDAVALIGRHMGIEELSEVIDTEALAAQSKKLQELLEAGVLLSPKVTGAIMNPASGGGGAGGGGLSPNPNPLGNMGQGITPGAERRQIRQEAGAEMQADMKQGGGF